MRFKQIVNLEENREGLSFPSKGFIPVVKHTSYIAVPKRTLMYMAVDIKFGDNFEEAYDYWLLNSFEAEGPYNDEEVKEQVKEIVMDLVSQL